MGVLEDLKSHKVSDILESPDGKLTKHCRACGDKYLRVGEKWVPLSRSRPCPGPTNKGATYGN